MPWMKGVSESVLSKGIILVILPTETCSQKVCVYSACQIFCFPFSDTQVHAYIFLFKELLHWLQAHNSFIVGSPRLLQWKRNDWHKENMKFPLWNFLSWVRSETFLNASDLHPESRSTNNTRVKLVLEIAVKWKDTKMVYKCRWPTNE